MEGEAGRVWDECVVEMSVEGGEGGVEGGVLVKCGGEDEVREGCIERPSVRVR